MITKNTCQELKGYGIYEIINTITKDVYVGSTTRNFSSRLSQHKSGYRGYLLKNLKTNHPILYNAYNKYGIENFEFKIIKRFINKKDSKKTKEIISYIEEKHINKINPKYNVCKKPTIGGCPNLGKKLSEEWKLNIGKKSKLYKHVGEIYENKVLQNKQNASYFKICTIDECFTGSLIDCSKHFNVDYSTIWNNYTKRFKSKIFITIERIKSQKKKLKLFINNKEIIFNSYGECDRYLNMWRGFTSTQIVNKKSLILKYKYELINEDIV